MNRIAELRKDHNLSQRAFGKIVGAAQNTVCNWENGKREPDNDTIVRIAGLFGVSVDYLLGKDDCPTPKNTFEERLKQIRNEKQLSQAELAKELGVSQSTVGMWENGKNKPGYPTLIKLSKIFDVSLDYLLGEDKNDKSDAYYIDDDARKLAEEMSQNPDLHILFDAARSVSTEDLQFVIEMVKKLKRNN